MIISWQKDQPAHRDDQKNVDAKPATGGASSGDAAAGGAAAPR